MTKLTRWSPFAEIESFRREIDRLFREAFGDLPRAESRTWVPQVNIYEGPETVVVQADLPGLNKDQIQVDVSDDRVTIRGRRELERSEDRTYHLIERWEGEFERSFSLDVRVDAEKSEATYRDGVLTLVLPKKDASKVRRIPVSE